MRHESEENELKAERVQFWAGLVETGRATVDTVYDFLDAVIAAAQGLKDLFGRLIQRS